MTAGLLRRDAHDLLAGWKRHDEVLFSEAARLAAYPLMMESLTNQAARCSPALPRASRAIENRRRVPPGRVPSPPAGRPTRRNYGLLPPHRPVPAEDRGDERAPRSEERRVGKECRSRWSP